MSPAALLDQARALGVTVTADRARYQLAFKPAGRLPPDLRAALIGAKAEIVPALTGNAECLRAVATVCDGCGARTLVSAVSRDGRRACARCLARRAAWPAASGAPIEDTHDVAADDVPAACPAPFEAIERSVAPQSHLTAGDRIGRAP